MINRIIGYPVEKKAVVFIFCSPCRFLKACPHHRQMQLLGVPHYNRRQFLV
jgi:hypothetical protein